VRWQRWLCIAALAIGTQPAPAARTAPASAKSNATAAHGYASSLLQAAAALEKAASRPHAPPPPIHIVPAHAEVPARPAATLDRWLQSRLHDAASRRKPAERAQSMRDTAAALRLAADDTRSSTAPPDDAADPGITARAILSTAPYLQGPDAKPQRRAATPWQIFKAWLARRIDRIFAGLLQAVSASPRAGDLLAVALGAAAAGALTVALWRLTLRLKLGRRRLRHWDGGQVMASPPDAEALRGQSLAAAERGQYPQAIALLFQSCLLNLDRSGSVAYDQARTAGQYTAAVRSAVPARAPAFDTLARAFSTASYARRPVGRADWSEALAAYEALAAVQTAA